MPDRLSESQHPDLTAKSGPYRPSSALCLTTLSMGHKKIPYPTLDELVNQ